MPGCSRTPCSRPRSTPGDILRRVATYSQSPDHPIIPMIPETEYLKGFAFEVVR